jgi:hypothetical protein
MMTGVTTTYTRHWESSTYYFKVVIKAVSFIIRLRNGKIKEINT